jgi:hypothetical protein
MELYSKNRRNCLPIFILHDIFTLFRLNNDFPVSKVITGAIQIRNFYVTEMS